MFVYTYISLIYTYHIYICIFIYVCIYLYIPLDSITCVARLVHMSHMTDSCVSHHHSYVSRNLFICVT